MRCQVLDFVWTNRRACLVSLNLLVVHIRRDPDWRSWALILALYPKPWTTWNQNAVLASCFLPSQRSFSQVISSSYEKNRPWGWWHPLRVWFACFTALHFGSQSKRRVRWEPEQWLDVWKRNVLSGSRFNQDCFECQVLYVLELFLWILDGLQDALDQLSNIFLSNFWEILGSFKSSRQVLGHAWRNRKTILQLTQQICFADWNLSLRSPLWNFLLPLCLPCSFKERLKGLSLELNCGGRQSSVWQTTRTLLHGVSVMWSWTPWTSCSASKLLSLSVRSWDGVALHFRRNGGQMEKTLRLILAACRLSNLAAQIRVSVNS